MRANTFSYYELSISERINALPCLLPWRSTLRFCLGVTQTVMGTKLSVIKNWLTNTLQL